MAWSLALRAVLVTVVLVGGVARAEDAATRPAVPGAAALQKATKLIDELYGAEIGRATQPAAMTVLAKQLIQTAAETKGDPAGQFATYSKARDLAAKAGDAETAYKAIDGLARAFAIDALGMRAD